MEGRLKYIIIMLSLVVLLAIQAFGQDQTCPANINFSFRDLSNWSIQTGLVNGATQAYALPNTGVSTIVEYGLTTTGIQVLSSAGTDKYGGFKTVPTINGYAYGYSVKLGSDVTSWDLNRGSRNPGNGNPGGFTRAITYTVNVPAGAATDPYTMTYAYALVLENGTHNSNQQPLFKATVKGSNGIITCASPSYYLPTLNDAHGGNGQAQTGATLDSAAAKADGFSLSPTLFFSHAGQNNSGAWLQDVWTKPWTEVTFDLAPYRGQQVTITFEADNCTPGAHFAYAYIALRNECAGLNISGFEQACTNTNTVYSIPALANSTYTWTIPDGWTMVSGSGTNIITVKPGSNGGVIKVREVNSCADLKDEIAVTTMQPTVAGNVLGDDVVCSGVNSSKLSLTGQRGNILLWVSSTDGNTWDSVGNTTAALTVQNLTATTYYKAVVQNGIGCTKDSSAGAVITVNPLSDGGVLSPANKFICEAQTQNTSIILNKSIGQVQNWQVSYDSVSWSGFSPANVDTQYNVNSIDRTLFYRTIVKSGVCPSDTSTVSKVTYVNVQFPQAKIDPGNASICYGTSTALYAVITNGTHYTWNNTETLSNTGTGTPASMPYAINAIAAPKQTTDYILTVSNEGCPNTFTDTFHVNVTQPIKVFAGNDTFITASQPLQMNITVSDSLANQILWSPGTGLSNTAIADPIASLWNMSGKTIVYNVRATTVDGCFGEDDIKVVVFTTAPDIFVPSAFSPNGDGLNDILRPIPVGITRLDYFRIYNRWGQLVYSGIDSESGWDGTVNGKIQTTGSFVYVTQGVDYTGKTIVKKGLITIVH